MVTWSDDPAEEPLSPPNPQADSAPAMVMVIMRATIALMVP